MLLSSKNMIQILKRTLNLIDYRIVDHCERVAYIVIEMLKFEGGYTDEELVEICILCMLHDIGAFKTEDIDSLVDTDVMMGFEVKNTIDHAIYGYLFVKNFSVLSNYSDALLYHHSRYDDILKSECKNKSLAMKIFLADRIDILLGKGNLKFDENLFFDYRDTIFSSKDIDIILEIEKSQHISEKIKTGKYEEILLELYSNLSLSHKKIESFLKTIIYSIDFRSKFTVLHTIITVAISVELAKSMNMNNKQINKIYYGSLLHDIGKISTSLLILEKEGKLTDYEYSIMKDHIYASESILTGLIDEEVFKISVRHHEKMDGSGYPHGINEDELSISECIVCVADITSALVGKRSYKNAFEPDKIKNILQNMADTNKLNKEVVKCLMKDYDKIMLKVEENSKDALETYDNLFNEYQTTKNIMNYKNIKESKNL